MFGIIIAVIALAVIGWHFGTTLKSSQNGNGCCGCSGRSCTDCQKQHEMKVYPIELQRPVKKICQKTAAESVSGRLER